MTRRRRNIRDSVREPKGAGRLAYRMWQTMRLMRRVGRNWIVDELAGHAECSPDHARSYVRALRKHGYVEQLVERPKRSQPGRYRLVRDTGPRAPELNRAGLYDPNTNELSSWQGAAWR